MGEPGEHIGLRLAHNILASITQDSLSSFHNAGLASTSTGRDPQEIMDGIDGGSMSIVLMRPTKAPVVVGNIVRRQLRYYIQRITNTILEQPEDGNFWYEIGRSLDILPGPTDIPIEDLIVVRMELDYRKLLQDHRTLEHIVATVFRGYRVYFSPDFMGLIDIHLSSTVEISDVVRLVDLYIGVPNVDACAIVGERVITSGSNLQAMALERAVDVPNTTSTDIRDVERNFGIEAARGVIYNEMLRASKNPESSSFMADFMTCKGVYSPFRKHNPMLRDKGFFASISFERPKEDIKEILENKRSIGLDSSVYSDIITGNLPNTGTGSRLFRLLDPRDGS
ncbi:hypothetical protein BGZ89_005721 [Linnemannia elongata]|nr:hypothetical protein BGZ89_005721 [Linnemannia elongata]